MLHLLVFPVLPSDGLRLPEFDFSPRHPAPALAAPALRRQETGADTNWLETLLIRQAPEFIVHASRTSLLHATTALTRICDRAHRFFSRVSQALALDRMLRTLLSWGCSPAHGFPCGTFALSGPSLLDGRWRSPSANALSNSWWQSVTGLLAPKPGPMFAAWGGFCGLPKGRTLTVEHWAAPLFVAAPFTLLEQFTGPLAGGFLAWIA